ncbi:MAG: type I-E CRISPR-associated protein Cas6/Cse3/CasE [Candidatus Rifleibacteriota bacterium]
MYVSKFLLNRQKIYNPPDINRAISGYFPEETQAGKDYLYRLEWYKIGVVVPVLVYSKTAPKMHVNKEFQLFESGKKDKSELSPGESKRFSIFLVPNRNKNFDPVKNFDSVCSWFAKQLKDAAEIREVKHGPDNCIYYIENDKNYSQQTITLSGTLAIQSPDQLEALTLKPLGQKPELGCGLLYLY